MSPCVDRERHLLAAVVFFTACDRGGCVRRHRTGDAITDAGGSIIRL